ncbi:Endoglucanase precursor [compost metagenome]
MDYVRATYANNMLTTGVNRFSKLAVLNYDKSFEDVNASYWADDMIKKMAAKQILFGISETEFAPKKNVTRAEFVTIITRALEIESSKPNVFKDVDPTKWYASYIAAAFEAGIVSGRTTDVFAPEETLSREEMAIMILKAYKFHTGQNAVADEMNNFRDADTISDWAKDAVSAAAKLGFIKGRGKELFMPHEKMNRAESAHIISLFLEEISK